MWVVWITSCFIIGENLICRFFTIRQTTKLKSSPNFPTIRYIESDLGTGNEGCLYCRADPDAPSRWNPKFAQW